MLIFNRLPSHRDAYVNRGCPVSLIRFGLSGWLSPVRHQLLNMILLNLLSYRLYGLSLIRVVKVAFCFCSELVVIAVTERTHTLFIIVFILTADIYLLQDWKCSVRVSVMMYYLLNVCCVCICVCFVDFKNTVIKRFLKKRELMSVLGLMTLIIPAVQ